MSDIASFEEQVAHRHFAAQCFNHAWSFLDRPDRSGDDERAMIDAAHASAWHWSQVEDRTPRNESIGLWQLSRVYAVAGDAARAADYARRCLKVSIDNEVGAFFVGFAYEALARAESLTGDADRTREYLTEGLGWAEKVTDEDERRQLRADLESIDLRARG